MKGMKYCCRVVAFSWVVGSIKNGVSLVAALASVPMVSSHIIFVSLATFSGGLANVVIVLISGLCLQRADFFDLNMF